MSRCIQLVVFAIFAVVVLFFICEKSHAEDFYDDSGKCIGSALGNGKTGPTIVDYREQLKKAQAIRKKAVPKPKPKPVANKPSTKPKPKVDETARIRKIVQEEIRKAEARQKAEAKKFKAEELVSSTVIGVSSTALAGTVIPALATTSAIISGGAGAAAAYAAKCIYDNPEYIGYNEREKYIKNNPQKSFWG